MSFSYSGDPSTSATDAVRFYVPDTAPPGLLSDEEIAYLLTQAGGDVTLAVALAMRQIANRFAQEAYSQKTGQIRTDYSKRAEYWLRRLEDWQRENGIDPTPVPTSPWVGGVDRAEVEANNEDESVIKPSFYKGIHDNRLAGETDDEDGLRFLYG